MAKKKQEAKLKEPVRIRFKQLANGNQSIYLDYYTGDVIRKENYVGGKYAITAGIMRITSEVSLTARPFFEKKGYVVEEEQKRKANQLSLTNFWMAREVTKIQRYEGRIPACGVFCGGCPTYTREKNPCKGAELNSSRCEKCKTFHLCCLEKEITHCFQCSSFPCARFKGFTKRWLKYGQNFIENQKLLSEIGEVAFLEYYNKKVTD